jgi:hypothetical protein
LAKTGFAVLTALVALVAAGLALAGFLDGLAIRCFSLFTHIQSQI